MEIFRFPISNGMDALQGVVRAVLSASSDGVVLAILVAGLAAYGFFWGKQKIVALILSLYVSAFLFESIPYFQNVLGETSVDSGDVLVKLFILAATLVPVAFIMEHFVSTEFSFSRFRKFIEAGLLGVSAGALLVAFSYHVVNIQELYNFSAGIDALFAGERVFWWLLAPLVALFFVRK